MYHNHVALNFSDVEHESLAQLFQNVNRGEKPVTFSCHCLPDTNPDAITIYQFIEGITFSFDVNKEGKTVDTLLGCLLTTEQKVQFPISRGSR